MAERITPREKDFAQWYSDVIQHAKLADYSPVRGCMVLRPTGYALWEVVQRELNQRFKETGHQNAYFPIFIPESFLGKEKDHVEGFAPQCAVVTHGGGKKLEEALIVRPTSETIINSMYAKWIKSYRDLPVLINQWANVVRWEMRTKPFLRTTEFLWQEGHTCHETAKEALEETHRMLQVYQDFVNNILAIPVVPGEKTKSEKFAGALHTFCIEALLQDKKALQAATSHFFGTKFAEVFEIQFQNRQGKLEHVHQTTWGMSTRIIGALIMVHSDDDGLVLPPLAAPIPAVVLPVLLKGKDNSEVLRIATELHRDLKVKIPSVHLDSREEHSLGYKIHDWEIQGVPFRIEFGARDLETKEVVLARRDKKKEKIPLDQIVSLLPKKMAEFQKELYNRANQFLQANLFSESDYGQFKKRIEEGGFFSMPWCGNEVCEAAVKEETKATIRCLPFQAEKATGKCIYCAEPAKEMALFARSY